MHAAAARADAVGTDAPDATGPTTLPWPAAIGLVAVGGAFGTGARFELGLIAPAATGGFPGMTFAVNVSGALLLGVLLTLLTGRWSGHPRAALARPLLTTGFTAAYTTWSTYMVEVAVLARDGSTGMALAYLAASLVVGLSAATVGMALAGSRATGVRPPVRR